LGYPIFSKSVERLKELLKLAIFTEIFPYFSSFLTKIIFFEKKLDFLPFL